MNARFTHSIRLLLLAGALATFATPGAAGEIVVANETIRAEAIDEGALEQLFLGKSRKLDGQSVAIAVLSDGATHADFLTTYLGKRPKQFLSHWRRVVFSGKGSMPDRFDSEEALVAHVLATPGAIGYIDATTPHDGLKVLAVSD